MTKNNKDLKKYAEYLIAGKSGIIGEIEDSSLEIDNELLDAKTSPLLPL